MGSESRLRSGPSIFRLPVDRKDANFWIELPEGKRKFGELSETAIRDFGEYSIPTIEITLTDETPLDEIIDLFVDINQEGEPVKRFDIVKAMGKDSPLLKSVFDLIAQKESSTRDVYYKPKHNDFTAVLKHLSLISKLPDSNAKVDRMWERLLEVVSFVRNGKHRQPVEILKSFIKTREQRDSRPEAEAKISSNEMNQLRRLFRVLKAAHLDDSPFGTDQPHFYTMATSIISAGFFDQYEESELAAKLHGFATALKTPPRRGNVAKEINGYLELSKKQTTHPGRREERQNAFISLFEKF